LRCDQGPLQLLEQGHSLPIQAGRCGGMHPLHHREHPTRLEPPGGLGQQFQLLDGMIACLVEGQAAGDREIGDPGFERDAAVTSAAS
jgi:hypothetical protein